MLKEAVDEDAWVSAQFLVIVPGDAPPVTRWPPLRHVLSFLVSLGLLLAIVLGAAIWFMRIAEGLS